jgi:hypothetical protein
MKENLKTICCGIACLIGLASMAQAAVYINGNISFSGGATLNGPLTTATAFDSFFGPVGPGTGVPVVSGATGNYAGVPGGTAATFTPFTFNPAPAGTIPLWNFTLGPTSYSFQITSLVVISQNASFLNIQGTGVANITGFDATPGTWSITDTGFGGAPVLTFGAGVSVVPEPSASALLVGLGLVSFAVRRWTMSVA